MNSSAHIEDTLIVSVGKSMYESGTKYDLNPYPIMSTMWAEWNIGWLIGFLNDKT